MLDPLKELLVLSGIRNQVSHAQSEVSTMLPSDGNRKAQLMRQHNIKPGTPEWFRLWFSKEWLTGETEI